MTSWIKRDNIPIWWPPKLDDLYKKTDPTLIIIATAIGGWFAFIVVYGIAIFAIAAMWRWAGI